MKIKRFRMKKLQQNAYFATVRSYIHTFIYCIKLPRPFVCVGVCLSVPHLFSDTTVGSRPNFAPKKIAPYPEGAPGGGIVGRNGRTGRGHILCDASYGVGAHGMEWVHYRKP